METFTTRIRIALAGLEGGTSEDYTVPNNSWDSYYNQQLDNKNNTVNKKELMHQKPNQEIILVSLFNQMHCL